MHRPSYIELHEKGILKERLDRVKKIYQSCTICPHQCKVNRFKTKQGYCQTNARPFIASYNAHFGEEAPLVGHYGSGTIFFAGCNMRCKFCQNCEISQLGEGHELGHEDLADIMLLLQNKGCHNINLVSPSHMVYQILEALEIATRLGLHLPIVYNSGGYDSLETVKLLDGVIDIYMPDFKYANNKLATTLSGAKNYPETAYRALQEMHRQVGDLKIDQNGIAYRGLIVRHLVLPGNEAKTGEIMQKLASISKNMYVNLMDQYRPEFMAMQYPGINRPITREEFSEAREKARKAGLVNLA